MKYIKKNLIVIVFLQFVFFGGPFAQTATAPSGSGTSADPYRIATLNNLYWLSQTTSAWAAGTYFIQTADINASSTSSWNSGAGFTPIGNSTPFFEGNYNGNGHTIEGLYFNQPSTLRLGLFGTIANTTIQNLGVINVNINGGSDHIGAVVAVNRDSNILKCFSSGTITSNASNVGGIIGYNNEYCTVSNSYSTVSIVNNSTYANIGGLVGRNFDRSTVSNSYAAGLVTSSANNVGGFCGWNAGTITNSFWNASIVSTGIGFGTTTGATGNTTTQMKALLTFTNAGWDFKGETTNGTNDYWGINSFDNNGYPFLSRQGHVVAVTPAGSGTSADPYLIATLDNLFWVTQNTSSWSKHFKQTADIDASSSSGWYWGLGFSPIGIQGGVSYSGTYDGNNYKINGIFINNPSASVIGLFGISWGGEINNLGVTNVNITGGNYVGGIIGACVGMTINNCYVTGDVVGDSVVGGMVGGAYAVYHAVSPFYIDLTGSNSNCTVEGNYSAGGLIGELSGSKHANNYLANITNSYSKGAVSCSDMSGGLIGEASYSSISSCYSNSYVAYGPSLNTTYISGGLIANSDSSTINNCYSISTCYLGIAQYFGGIVGINNATIINNSYSINNLVIASGLNPTTNNIGGLVGKNLNQSGTINNSFWYVTTTASSTYSDGGTYKTTTQLKTSSTFINAGWDSNVWYMNSGINNGFPYLAWQNPSGTPLPVELTNFTANVNEDKVELNWKTATEVNNYGFEILRSTVAEAPEATDEQSWETLGFVQGVGNSNSVKEYSFTDNSLSSGTYKYKLKQIDNNGQFKYSDIVEIAVNSLPSTFELAQNFPNPFNPSTNIRYSLPVRQTGIPSQAGETELGVSVQLKIYDILGNEVATLVNEKQSAGNYQVEFNGSQLASGVYLYRLLTSSGFVATKKLMLLK